VAVSGGERGGEVLAELGAADVNPEGQGRVHGAIIGAAGASAKRTDGWVTRPQD
jgi:hypothetical protein